jgi:hypothetical protein
MLKYFRNIACGAAIKQAPTSYEFRVAQLRAKLVNASK